MSSLYGSLIVSLCPGGGNTFGDDPFGADPFCDDTVGDDVAVFFP